MHMRSVSPAMPSKLHASSDSTGFPSQSGAGFATTSTGTDDGPSVGPTVTAFQVVIWDTDGPSAGAITYKPVSEKTPEVNVASRHPPSGDAGLPNVSAGGLPSASSVAHAVHAGLAMPAGLVFPCNA